MATCCSIFAWKHPKDQSMESRRVGHDLATEHMHRGERGLCRTQRTEGAGEREGCEDRGEPQGTQPHIYMHTFSPKLPFHPGCHITLSRVLCTCYTLSPCWLSFFNTAVCICQSQTGFRWGEGVDDAGEQRKNCW